MNFESTRSNFSYIPSEGKLVSNTGDLSKQIIKDTPPSLVSLDSKRVSNIIQASQYLSDKITVFISPTQKDNLQRVSLSLENYTVTESVLKDSIELFKNSSVEAYYKFCYHSEANIVPFAPVEGILSIATEDYQSVISVNHYESTTQDTAVPLSDTTQISFFINPNDTYIKSIIKRFTKPDCDIVLDHPEKEIKQKRESAADELADDIYKIHKSEGNIEYGSRWNTRKSKIYINGQKVDSKIPDNDEKFKLQGKIDNACGAVYNPSSKYHNKIVLDQETIKELPDKLEKYTVSEEKISTEIIIPMRSSCEEIEQYMSTQLYTYYTEVLQQNIKSDTAIVSDLSNLSIEFVRLLFRSLRSLWDYSKHGNAFRNSTAQQLKTEIQDKLGYTTNTNFSDFEILTNRCYIAPIDHPHKTRSSQMFRTYVGCILRITENIEGNVYMGVNLQSKKTKVLKQDSQEHILVKVSNTDQYSLYKDEYGWIKQKDITAKNIDTFDISEDLQQEFKSTSANSQNYTKKKESIPERKLTVHKKKNSSKQTMNTTFKKHKQKLQSSDKILIIYPRSAEENLTDNTDYLTEYIQMAAPSSNKEIDYLRESESVYTHTEYIDEIESFRFNITKDADRAFSEIKSLKGIGYTPIYHIINDIEKQLLKTESELKTLAKQRAKTADIDDDITSCQYIPLTLSDYRFIEPFVEKGEDVILASPDLDFNLYGYNEYKSNFSLFEPYIDFKLPEDSQEKSFFTSRQLTDKVVTEEFITVIDKLCE